MTAGRWLAIGMLVMSGVAVACHYVLRPNARLASEEQYAVYSSYIERGLTGEERRFGDGAGLVLILDETELLPAYSEPSRVSGAVSGLLSLRRMFPRADLSLLYNSLFAGRSRLRFEPKFKTSGRCDLINKSEAHEGAFMKRFPKNHSYLMFSPIAFNRELSEALFYAGHQCGVCGQGEYVVMRKTNRQWRVVGWQIIWVS